MKKDFARKALPHLFPLFIICLLPAGLVAQEMEWPREIVAPKATILIYQPQPETFSGNHVKARSAVSVTMQGNPEPIFGAAWYDATVSTDRDNRTVQYQEVKVTDVKFPDATTEQEEQFKTLVSREMTGWRLQGSLDRLLTTLELAKKEEQLSTKLNNDPPKILYSEQPAVLVPIDGKPILKAAEGSEVQQVVNTAFQIFFDPASKTYYLKGDPQWFSASELLGDWKVASEVPDAVQRLVSAVDSSVSYDAAAPKIFVATEPTELILAQGAPEWAPIAGTDLQYLKNSDNAVFLQQPGNAYYALISGRWFETKPAPVQESPKSPGGGLWGLLVGSLPQAAPPPDVAQVTLAEAMKGSWSYVSPDKLPESFRKIPSDFDRDGVLASIPGTEEAQDAAMDAQIPQTTVIDKKQAKFTPTYDGAADFKAVAGTSMEYAANTPDQIIKDGDKYYACDQGVWYVADSPDGPFRVSDARPPNIDQLPPDNPNYNTKYVYVYDSDDDHVSTGYTAGYLGSFILGTTLGAALTWGSGYNYPGWYGGAYYPRPSTYGYRAYYNPYNGAWGYRGPNGGAWHRPYANNWNGNGYWGPGGYRNVNIDNVNIDRSRTNIDRNEINNNIYNRKQNADRNVSRDRMGQVERQRLDKLGDRGPLAGRDPSKVQGDKLNNVFADKDGNVFRKDADGQWQRREGDNWAKADGSGPRGDKDLGGLKDRQPGGEGVQDRVAGRDHGKAAPAARDKVQRDRPAPQAKAAHSPAKKRDVSFNQDHMNRESHARQRGNQRAQNYQQHASRSPQRGSGGIHSGGGGGGHKASMSGGGRSHGGGGAHRGGGGGGGHRGGGRRR